jgi:hypothetical protein
MKKIYLICNGFPFCRLVSAVSISYEKNDLGVNDMRVKISDTNFFGLIKENEIGQLKKKSHKKYL